MNEKKNMKGLPKRILSFMLTLAMVLSLMPTTNVWADYYDDDDINCLDEDDYYDESSGLVYGCDWDDMTAYIKGYTDAFEGVVNVSTITPYTGFEFTVTGVYYSAFWECNKLTSITLPNATYIGSYAFNECESLTSVNLPNVTSISDGAFYQCESLESISLPELTSIGNYAFCKCWSLENLEIPNTFTVIPENVFDGTRISYFDFSNVTTVKEAAFSGTLLNNVDLSNISTIGDNAFWMTSLTSIELTNATSIGALAFEECTSLTSVTIGRADCVVADDAFNEVGGQYASVRPTLTLPEGWPSTDLPDAEGNWHGGNFAVGHTHGNWIYNAVGNILTATCGNSDCDLTDSKVSLTLTATSANYSGNAYVGASLGDTATWTGAGLTAPTIKYVGRLNTIYPESETAPTDIGTYTALVTVSDKTISKDFEITKKSSPTPTPEPTPETPSRPIYKAPNTSVR